MSARRPGQSSGFSLIEVLVTMVILLVGLLGLAKLQGVAVAAQTESYQRTQALVLLQDMTDRINANRTNALAYVTATPLGTDNSLGDCSALNGQALDFCQWNNALLGAAETKGADSVGGMIGARGCIYNTVAATATDPAQFLVAVAWQGLHKTAALASVDCAEDLYGDPALRRVVTLTITIAKLD